MSSKVLFIFFLLFSCASAMANGSGGRVLAPDFFWHISADSLPSLSAEYDLDMSKYEMVTRQFGPTVIDLTQLPFSSAMLDSGQKAWSSWWFQKLKHEYDDDPKTSILAKYDRVFGLTGTGKSAFTNEREREKSAYSPWEGLCDAWALASLFYPEPVKPKTIHGVTFSVAELKGLILKTFEAVPDSDFSLYGEKFLGTSDAWMFPDIFPDQFHRFVEIALGQKKQAFVMDRDPGVEVWTVPVYKADYRIEANPADASSVFVKMWLFTAGASSYDSRNSVGTDEFVYEYSYELSGNLSADHRQLVVTSGKWTQSGLIDSRSNHPDYVLLPKRASLMRASYNPFVDPAKVDQITRGAF
jgi:hypothetical protein